MLDAGVTIGLAVAALVAGISALLAYMYQGLRFEDRYNKHDNEVENARSELIRVLQLDGATDSDKCQAISRYVIAEHLRDGVCSCMLFGRYVRAFKTTVKITKYCLAVCTVVGAAYMTFASQIEQSGGTPFALLLIRLLSAFLIVFLLLDLSIGMSAKRLDEKWKV